MLRRRRNLATVIAISGSIGTRSKCCNPSIQHERTFSLYFLVEKPPGNFVDDTIYPWLHGDRKERQFWLGWSSR